MRPLFVHAVVLLRVGGVWPAVAAGDPTPAPCRFTGPRAIAMADLELPDGLSPSASTVRYIMDLGSDGRVRHVRVLQTSGDAALDTIGRQTLERSTFAAATEHCIAVSSVYEFRFSLDQYPSTARAPATAPPPEPCYAFVQPILRRTVPPAGAKGTVWVEVSLSARAIVTKSTVSKSSGDATLDIAAHKTAEQANYVYFKEPGCTPGPTTYRLELTYGAPA